MYRLVFAFVWIIFGVSASVACSCSVPSVREKFRSSALIFSGEVVSFRSIENPPAKSFPFETVFKVDKQWKGKKQRQTTVFADIDLQGMCGDLDLNVGEKFLIYARKINGVYVFNRDCPISKSLEYADKDIKKLNNPFYRIFTGIYPYPKF